MSVTTSSFIWHDAAGTRRSGLVTSDDRIVVGQRTIGVVERRERVKPSRWFLRDYPDSRRFRSRHAAARWLARGWSDAGRL